MNNINITGYSDSTLSTIDSGLSPESTRNVSRTLIVLGILSALVGAIVIWIPGFAVDFSAIMLGISLVFLGISQCVLAFSTKDSVMWKILYFAVGLLSIIVGGTAIFQITSAVILLATFVGIVWLSQGIADFVILFSGQTFHKIYHTFMGIVGVIAGIAMLVSPFFATVSLLVLAIMSGISLLILGIIEIVWGVKGLKASK